MLCLPLFFGVEGGRGLRKRGKGWVGVVVVVVVVEEGGMWVRRERVWWRCGYGRAEE